MENEGCYQSPFMSLSSCSSCSLGVDELRATVTSLTIGAVLSVILTHVGGQPASPSQLPASLCLGAGQCANQPIERLSKEFAPGTNNSL